MIGSNAVSIFAVPDTLRFDNTDITGSLIDHATIATVVVLSEANKSPDVLTRIRNMLTTRKSFCPGMDGKILQEILHVIERTVIYISPTDAVFCRETLLGLIPIAFTLPMKTPLKALLLLSVLLTLSRSSQAETTVTVEHIEAASSADAFKFKTVPSPRPSAALGAAFKVVGGDPDGNGVSLDALHDGKLPDEEDQPDANFFFEDDSDGGRLLVDLGKVIPIKEVDTYSRHPSTRAPQVYKLYGSDGGGVGFVAEPKRPQDPAQGGWKLLATVDTRAKFGHDGGQYGVKIADPEQPLGSYRYLLFDVMRTEGDDSFGNTFYSEISVSGAVWMGIGVEPVSEVLRAQLSLEPDSGLAVSRVVADSSAAKAGLQVNDVLTRFNDQKLVSPTQLITLIAAQHAGDTVRLSYVRRAQLGVAEVKLEIDNRVASNEAPAVQDKGAAGNEAPAAPGKVMVTVNHNENASATGAFKFKTVPSPRPTAALGATFKVADGETDGNSATLDVLHDGKLPDEEDQPDANFFLDGSHGGQVTMDLGKVVPIREVDTYSWHPSTRAPQVYKLLGRETADDASEWKLIAEVDTRKQFGDAGGQYGVKVAAANGIIGRYRYLSFNLECTEDDDSFGNTFYSEINVVADGDAPVPSMQPAAKEMANYDREGLHLAFTDDSTGFNPKEKERLVNTFFTVYPQMVSEFNHDAPKRAKILLDPDFHGVAQTEGTTIRCNPAWFRDHPEDLDVITHESMHVVQQYRRYDPSWITEGIADYARAKFGVNNAAGDWTMPEYAATQSYQDAYRVTARFFVWLEKHVKPGVVLALDQSMREGKYTPEFWTQQTGKDVDALWQDYGKNPVL